jgi:hypothetical protein
MSDETPAPTSPTVPVLPLRTPLHTTLPVLPTPGQGMVLAPCVGGVIPDGSVGKPWTGGSNINPLLLPIHLGQRHPLKYGSSKALLDDLAKGFIDKLGTNNEKSDCAFQLWMKQQSQAHVKFGMDTPFLIPNPTWTSETNIFNNHTVTWDKVKCWVDQLLTGVRQPSIAVPGTTTLRHVCAF